jgi:hypothetical protein
MLAINVKISGEKIHIEGLEQYSDNIHMKAIPRALRRTAKGSTVEALALLSGPRRGLKTITAKKSGRQRTVAKETETAGDYPVPRLTGHLRRLQGWLGPGRSKTANDISFATGPMEALIYNSAEYASAIHTGVFTTIKGSKYSPLFGPRPFMDDAFKNFNSGGKVKNIFEEEIAKEASDSGLD